MISYLDELSGDGCRVVTSVLKSKGHDVKSVFLPFFGAQEDLQWDPKLEQDIREADMFMHSVLSCYEVRAAAITSYLRKLRPEVPVVWGGVHATAMPEACLEFADYVIRGECEESVVAFCEAYQSGGDFRGVPNVNYLDDSGNMVQNLLSQLPFDLDEMPYPDYDLEDHYVLDGENIAAATQEIYAKYHTTYFHNQAAYFCMTTRGCPFVCTYCHQSELVNTYPTREFKSRTLRYKSVDKTIEECKFQLARMPFLQRIGFSDDDFFCRKVDQIREFAEKYPREIGLPFGVNVIPLSITEEKLKLLLDAGCVKFQIGIQSGSERLNKEVYMRHYPRKRLMAALDLLDKYHAMYDFSVDVDWIIDCPWETEDDVLETLKLSLQLPKWMFNNIFTLTFYPGTTIYTRALEEGIIKEDENVYVQAFNMLHEEGHSYLTHLFLAQNRLNAPHFLIKALASPPVRWVGSRMPNWTLNGLYNRKIYPMLLRFVKGTNKVNADCAFG